MLNIFIAISAKWTKFILFVLLFEIYLDIKHPGTHLEYHTSKLRIKIKKTCCRFKQHKFKMICFLIHCRFLFQLEECMPYKSTLYKVLPVLVRLYFAHFCHSKEGYMPFVNQTYYLPSFSQIQNFFFSSYASLTGSQGSLLKIPLRKNNCLISISYLMGNTPKSRYRAALRTALDTSITFLR